MSDIDKKAENEIADEIAKRLEHELHEENNNNNSFQFQQNLNYSSSTQNTNQNYSAGQTISSNYPEQTSNDFQQYSQPSPQPKPKIGFFEISKSPLLKWIKNRGKEEIANLKEGSNTVFWLGFASVILNILAILTNFTSMETLKWADGIIFIIILLSVIKTNIAHLIFSVVMAFFFSGKLINMFSSQRILSYLLSVPLGAFGIGINEIGISIIGLVELAIAWSILIYGVTFFMRKVFNEHKLTFNNVFPIFQIYLWQVGIKEIVIRVLTESKFVEATQGSYIIITLILLLANGWFFLGMSLSRGEGGIKSKISFWYILIFAIIAISALFFGDIGRGLFDYDSGLSKEDQNKVATLGLYEFIESVTLFGDNIKGETNIMIEEYICSISKKGNDDLANTFNKFLGTPLPEDACKSVKAREEAAKQEDQRTMKSKIDIPTYEFTKSNIVAKKMETTNIIVPFELSLDNSKSKVDSTIICKCRFNIGRDNTLVKEALIDYEDKKIIEVYQRKPKYSETINCQINPDEIDSHDKFYSYFGSTNYAPSVEAEVYCLLEESSKTRIKIAIQQNDVDEPSFNLKGHPKKNKPSESKNTNTQSSIKLLVDSNYLISKSFTLKTDLENHKGGKISNIKEWNLFLPENLNPINGDYEINENDAEIRLKNLINEKYKTFNLKQKSLDKLNKIIKTTEKPDIFDPKIEISENLFKDSNNIKEVYIYATTSYDYEISTSQSIDITKPWTDANEHKTVATSGSTTNLGGNVDLINKDFKTKVLFETNKKWGNIIEKELKKYPNTKITKAYILATIFQESSGIETKIGVPVESQGNKRAVGLNQFMPDTARDYGLKVDKSVDLNPEGKIYPYDIDERFNPERNIEVGVKYSVKSESKCLNLYNTENIIPFYDCLYTKHHYGQGSSVTSHDIGQKVAKDAWLYCDVPDLVEIKESDNIKCTASTFCEVERTTYEMLKKAASEAKSNSQKLIITSGYRNKAYQAFLSKNNKFDTASGSCTAPHVTGKAVDVKLADSSGTLLSGMTTKELPVENMNHENRKKLEKMMLNAGFCRYNGEFWHFDNNPNLPNRVCS